MFDFDKLWQTITILLMSSVAGIAKLLHDFEDERPTKWKMIRVVIMSGFSGGLLTMGFMWLVEIGVVPFHATTFGLGFVSGVGGLIGPIALERIIYQQLKKKGLDLDEKKKEGE